MTGASCSCRSETLAFDDFIELGFADSASPFLTPETRRWGRQLPLRASLLALILLVLSWFSLYVWHAPSTSYLLLLFVYFLAGIPALIDAIRDLLVLEVNIDVLMTLAAFSSVLIGSPMEGALLLVLFSLSGAIENGVEMKAKSAISSLKKLSPKKAYFFQEDGRLIEKSVMDIKPDDRILVKAGDVIPLDGRVIEGSAFVNLVHLTGEAAPQLKQVGDEVAAGGLTVDAALILKVVHSSVDSTIAKMIELVIQAQEAKPRLQRFFDRVSSVYAICIISLSFIFALSLPYVTTVPYLGYEGSIYRALAFLIAASPCALVLALPIAYLSAISACARKGILLKGGLVLDGISKAKAVAFDKTGTLTTGELACTGIDLLDAGLTLDEVIQIAASLEKGASHPISMSIVAYASSRQISHGLIDEFQVVPGYGVQGKWKGKKVFMGSDAFIMPWLDQDKKVFLEKQIHEAKSRGEIVAALKVDESLALFRFQDVVRSGIKELMERLYKKYHLRLLMLTGDHEYNAKRLAKEVGLSEYYADLKPQDKLGYVSQLAEKQGLVMVGDGINDAPALARATVGVAMGKVGSGAALDASDVVLLQDRLDLLDTLFDKAKKTRQVVRQNLLVASLAILLASVPALMGWVPLWLAVIMHEGGTVIVGLNALRLLR